MCQRCEDLEEEVAYLRSEMGERLRVERVDEVARRLKLAPGVTALLLILYGAKGRPVSIYQACEALPSPSKNEDRNPHLVAVYVTKIRKTLGADAIENVWGNGYRLTQHGMDSVGRLLGDVTAIDPVEIREIHDKPPEELRTMAALIAGLLAHKDGDGGAQTAITYRRIADRLTGQPRVAA